MRVLWDIHCYNNPYDMGNRDTERSIDLLVDG